MSSPRMLPTSNLVQSVAFVLVRKPRPRRPVEDAVTLDVRRASDRFRTRTELLDSRHSFSFGQHYDPANTHHGPLLACNEDVVAPGGGFGSHPHRDVELVTWVLSGELRHEDSTGRTAVLGPGHVQRLSAGSGVVHSEVNPGTSPARWVQLWITPDRSGGPPDHQAAQVDDARLRSGLVPLVSGLAAHAGAGVLTLGNAGVAVLAARLEPDQQVVVPQAPRVHLLVTAGSIVLAGAGLLHLGDAVRVRGAGALGVRAQGRAELLVCQMQELGRPDAAGR